MTTLLQFECHYVQWRIQELLVGGIIKGVDGGTEGRGEGGAKRRSAEGCGVWGGAP